MASLKMRNHLSLLLVLASGVPCMCLTSVSRDGVGPAQQQQSPPQGSAYEAPLPQKPFEQSHYELQPSPQYNYQPSYVDPAWGVNTGVRGDVFLGSWLEKGAKMLGDVVPVALSVIIVITILTFLGLVNIPILADFSETREQLGRAMENLDVDQLANTVHLAIDKYNEIFAQ